ncbi:MAG: fibrobacter succinogenes major paralogous domain-containing protein [Bacteroidales bacterium]|nr:fibrobacter succinogenes major paralogous domain-containing protein [Bacteroidales bacterium]
MIGIRKNISPFTVPLIVVGLLFLTSVNNCERFEPKAKLVVRTDSISEVSGRSFSIEGNIIYLGEDDITQHGFCYSEGSDPTIENSAKNELGEKSTTGFFQSTFTGLSVNTKYNVRAYATDISGTEYGVVKSFTTTIQEPTVQTIAISDISFNSAKSGGIVSDDGGSEVTARGVCWDTLSNPKVTGDRSTDGSGSGSYTSSLSSLLCEKTYYVRAYATNSLGTGYGDTISFTTQTCIANTPTVSTSSVSFITQSSAQSGGNVTSDGGAAVIAKGICWSTSQIPTLSDSYTSDGSGIGSFSSQMTGLPCGTSYFVRAYAINSSGTAYGNQVSFTTNQCTAELPTVTTTMVSGITDISANSGGNVTDDGGGSITARGVCWSTLSNPTIADNFTEDGNGIGLYTSNITGLTRGITYYVRAYATNDAGTAYGNEVSFKTYNGTVTDFNGNTYWTKVIGSQTWMAENLKVTRYSDGTEIPLVESTSAWDTQGITDKAYCFYENSSSNGDVYGALYTWAATMNGAESSTANPSGVQGVCPSGWHLPSDTEWTELTDHLGGLGIAGGKLKETGTIHWSNPNTGATNESGFTALPGGSRGGNGIFNSVGDEANFWVATEDGGVNAWGRNILCTSAAVNRLVYYKSPGFSVRCVRDD